jgi:hypothetical protein
VGGHDNVRISILALNVYNIAHYHPFYWFCQLGFPCTILISNNFLMDFARVYMFLAITAKLFIQEQIMIQWCLEAHRFQLLRKAGNLYQRSKSTLLQLKQLLNTESPNSRLKENAIDSMSCVLHCTLLAS